MEGGIAEFNAPIPIASGRKCESGPRAHTLQAVPAAEERPMKLPELSLRELLLLMLALVFAVGWWREREVSSLAAERNRVLENQLHAAKDAGWHFSYGKGEAGETIIALPPR